MRYLSSYHKVELSKDIILVKCTLCGKTASINATAEMIDNETYAFDGADCALMFKKFGSVYGSSFFNSC
jgi:tRNA 2-selenouridine synthase SelU